MNEPDPSAARPASAMTDLGGAIRGVFERHSADGTLAGLPDVALRELYGIAHAYASDLHAELARRAGRDPAARHDVNVYRVGPIAASVCVPADLPLEDVCAEADRQHPTGLPRGWSIDEAERFATGEPNPCPCHDDPARVHRLLAC